VAFETPEGPKSITVNGPFCTNNVVDHPETALAGVGVAWLPIYALVRRCATAALSNATASEASAIRIDGIMPKQAAGGELSARYWSF